MELIKRDEVCVDHPRYIVSIYHAEVIMKRFTLLDGMYYIVRIDCEIGETEDWDTEVKISRQFRNVEEARKQYKKWRKIYVKSVRKMINLHDDNDTEFLERFKSDMKETADQLL